MSAESSDGFILQGFTREGRGRGDKRGGGSAWAADKDAAKHQLDIRATVTMVDRSSEQGLV